MTHSFKAETKYSPVIKTYTSWSLLFPFSKYYLKNIMPRKIRNTDYFSCLLRTWGLIWALVGRIKTFQALNIYNVPPLLVFDIVFRSKPALHFKYLYVRKVRVNRTIWEGQTMLWQNFCYCHILRNKTGDKHARRTVSKLMYILCFA